MAFDRDELGGRLLDEYRGELESEDRDVGGGLYAKVFAPLIIIAVAAFAGYAWYSDNVAINRDDGEEVKLIRADSNPVRVKPKDPGGMYIADRDKKIYETISSSKNNEMPEVVRVLPTPEEPLDRKNLGEHEINVSRMLSVMEQNMPAEKVEEENEDRSVVAFDATAPVVEQESEPEKVESSKRDADVIVDKGVPSNVDISQKELAAIDVQVSEEIDNITIENVKFIPVPQKRQTKDFVSEADNDKSYVVQLGSYRSSEDVEKNWKRIKDTYPELLKDAKMRMQKANLGSKGIFYRLQAGNFKKASIARKTCQDLIEKKQGCFIVK